MIRRSLMTAAALLIFAVAPALAETASTTTPVKPAITQPVAPTTAKASVAKDKTTVVQKTVKSVHGKSHRIAKHGSKARKLAKTMKSTKPAG